MVRVSIVIPAYNRAHCIRRALESVRAQGEMGGVELILGDDASTDETWEVVRREFPEARLARLAVNAGAASARNAALRLACGEYVAFLDSDDEWLPGKIEAQLAFLEKNPDVAVCATGHVFARRDGGRREVRVENRENWGVALQAGQWFHGASTPVVRCSVLESVGLQDESLRVLEDWDWMLRIAQRYRIHVLPEVLAVIHENGPSDADFTRVATERFLAKHGEEFRAVGPGHFERMSSQHWENAARCFFRHSRNREGIDCLWRAIAFAPLRNPALVGALPLALVDGLLGSRVLRQVMAARGGYSIL